MTPDAPAAPVASLEAPVATETFAEDSFGSALDAFFAGDNPAQDPVGGEAPDGGAETPPGEVAEVPEGAENGETPTPDPLDEVDSTKEWTPQAARRFKELKAEAKATKARATELEATLAQRETRLKELEAIAEDPKVKELTSRSAEYEQAMLLNDLENSSAYRSLVSAPLERITGEIDALAEKYSISGDDLIDVVVMDDEAAQEERLGELLVRASDRDKFKLYKLIEETKPVLEQRRALHENAQEALHEVRELEAQQERVRLTDLVKQRTHAAQAVSERILAKLPFMSTLEGVDMAALAKEAGESDYSRLDPAVGTYNTMAGKLLPKLATQFLALQKESAALIAKLAEYDRVDSPLGHERSGGGSRSRAGGGVSFVDAVEAAFPR